MWRRLLAGNGTWVLGLNLLLIAFFTYLSPNHVFWSARNLQNQLLKDSDFMSMWHGLEIRVPFLDQELMALVYRIDGHLKFSDPLPKRLLIDAAGPDGSAGST